MTLAGLAGKVSPPAKKSCSIVLVCGRKKKIKKVIIKIFFWYFCFVGLSDMPVGTGTLYVVDCETEEEEAEEANCPSSSGTKKQRLNVEEGERGDPSEGF